MQQDRRLIRAAADAASLLGTLAGADLSDVEPVTANIPGPVWAALIVAIQEMARDPDVSLELAARAARERHGLTDEQMIAANGWAPGATSKRS